LNSSSNPRAAKRLANQGTHAAVIFVSVAPAYAYHEFSAAAAFGLLAAFALFRLESLERGMWISAQALLQGE
jgi:hypothetical protein